MYGRGRLAGLLSRAVLTINNDVKDEEEAIDTNDPIDTNDLSTSLSRTIDSLCLGDSSRWGRPGWDCYFMRMADLASLRSNCMKRRVGCILVDPKHHRVIATGYNGTARGLRNCADGGCTRCNRNDPCGVNLDDCICLHAEENALLEAGTGRAQGSTVYCTRSPCFGCAKRIVQVGVRRVVYGVQYSLAHNVEAIFGEAGIELVRFGGQYDFAMAVASFVSVSEFSQSTI